MRGELSFASAAALPTGRPTCTPTRQIHGHPRLAATAAPAAPRGRACPARAPEAGCSDAVAASDHPRSASRSTRHLRRQLQPVEQAVRRRSGGRSRGRFTTEPTLHAVRVQHQRIVLVVAGEGEAVAAARCSSSPVPTSSEPRAVRVERQALQLEPGETRGCASALAPISSVASTSGRASTAGRRAHARRSAVTGRRTGERCGFGHVVFFLRWRRNRVGEARGGIHAGRF